MGINEKLLLIQTGLRANKSQFNKFGNYSYRSLEDIYEAVKPLLLKSKTVLTINDDLEVFNGVIFRKSTATLTDVETNEKVNVHTYTQESLDRKGMSPEQCSGSVASYGNKYCLNKLFCIDDAKDADTRDNNLPKEEKNPTATTGGQKSMNMESMRKILMAYSELKGPSNQTMRDWINNASEANLASAIQKLKEKGEIE